MPENFVILAAANPYMFKTKKESENADLLKVKMAIDNQGKTALVYHVYPMAES